MPTTSVRTYNTQQLNSSYSLKVFISHTNLLSEEQRIVKESKLSCQKVATVFEVSGLNLTIPSVLHRVSSLLR